MVRQPCEELELGGTRPTRRLLVHVQVGRERRAGMRRRRFVVHWCQVEPQGREARESTPRERLDHRQQALARIAVALAHNGLIIRFWQLRLDFHQWDLLDEDALDMREPGVWDAPQLVRAHGQRTDGRRQRVTCLEVRRHFALECAAWSAARLGCVGSERGLVRSE